MERQAVALQAASVSTSSGSASLPCGGMAVSLTPLPSDHAVTVLQELTGLQDEEAPEALRELADEVTGIATGLFTTYRRNPPSRPSPTRNHDEPDPQAELDR